MLKTTSTPQAMTIRSRGRPRSLSLSPRDPREFLKAPAPPAPPRFSCPDEQSVP
jgi:hypothetical protein